MRTKEVIEYMTSSDISHFDMRIINNFMKFVLVRS